jgi:nucleotide-binding universal stress UspA family protein
MKVLIATDGSPYALEAARFTGKLTRQLPDCEITVIHVVDITLLSTAAGAAPAMGAAASVVLSRELEEVAKVALEKTQSVLQALGFNVVLRREQGRPADVICGVAQEEGFDLVVMGSSGMGRIAGILLGSVSDEVVHKSNVPVLVVRSKEQD